MNKLKKSTPVIVAGYKGVKVTSMIKAIEHSEVFSHLRLVQQDEFMRLRNRYNKNGYLTQPYFTYLWNLYWNFVLNDFRFDSDKSWTIVSKMKKVEPQHIGMKILHDLQKTKKVAVVNEHVKHMMKLDSDEK